MKVRSRSAARKKTFFRIVSVIITLALLLFLNGRIGTAIRTVAASRSQLYISNIVHKAVEETLRREEVDYESIVTLNQNQNGDTTALITNTIRLNELQSSIMKNIIKSIHEYDEMSVAIPLGTLIGGHWLSGLGPKVVFHLVPVGTVQTRILNSLDSCGINQTHHQIKLEATIAISSVIPGYRVRSETVTSIVLAETVIVGLVPDAYTEVYGGTDELVGMIEDYGAYSN